MKWLLLFVLASPFVARAQETTLQLPSTPVREMHVFGDRPVALDLGIDAAAGATVEVRADLVQLADGLAAPLQKDLVVAEALDFTAATHRQIHWSITLPAVKNMTRMAVTFRTSTRGAAWRPAERLLLSVYPKEGSEWRAVAQRAGLRLAVFGPAGELRAVLKAHGIKFEDLGAEWPGELPAGATVLGETTPAKLRDWLDVQSNPRGALIVCIRDDTALPLFSVESAREGLCVAKITFPIFDHLNTDPRAQKTLVDLINRATDLAAAR